MIREAVRYPIQPGWQRRIVIGSALITVSWLGIPLLILIGYLSTSLTRSSTGSQTPPEFTNYPQLIRKGALTTGILVTTGSLMCSVPLLVFSHGITVLTETTGVTTSVIEFRHLAYGFGLMLTCVCLTAPVVLCQYSRHEETNISPQLRQLAHTLRSRSMLKSIGLSVIVGITVTAAGGLVMFLTAGIAVVASPLVIFWTLTTITHLYGRGFGNAAMTTDLGAEDYPSSRQERTD